MHKLSDHVPQKVAIIEADVKARIVQRKAEKKARGSCSHVPRTYTPTISSQIASILITVL